MKARARFSRRWIVGGILLCGVLPPASASRVARAEEVATPGTYSVRRYGAVGDGTTLDTEAIQKAVDECAAAGGGQVLLPPGKYLSGTVLLKSTVTFKLQAGARLIGTADLKEYRSFAPPEGTAEARFRSKWHRALLLGIEVENVTIVGPGTIDGNKVFDPEGEERMRGPHTIILGNSRDVTIRDLDIVDSANYAIMIEFSSQVEVRRVKVTGGWDGVHFRGWSDRPCRDLSIVGCQFYTGDDSIAGRYAENVLISDCVVNSSCNGIRIIGPVRKMIVRDCLFYGPGVHPHRTQSRHNMLSGIILQPGGWDACEGPLEDVLLADITMKDVASPVTIYLKRPGNTADGIVVSRLSATGVYRAAASVESWTETPVGRVVFRDADIEYVGGGASEDGSEAPKPPGVDARPLPAWGFYARNAGELVLDDVRLRVAKEDRRPVVIAERVRRLVTEDLRFSRLDGVAEPVVLREVGKVEGYGLTEPSQAAAEAPTGTP